jgi:transmembrane sensor
MSNVHEFPERVDRLEEASQWLARIDRGLDAPGHQQLQQWLAAHPANATTLMEAARVWDKMDVLSRLADLFPLPQRKPQRRFAEFTWAAVVLVCVIGVALWAALGGGSTSLRTQGQLYQTAVGVRSTVALPDGSRLTLNTDSAVRVTYSDRSRRLVLERGELFVQVAPEKNRPLTVHVGDRFVQARGTAFNVKITEQQQIELIVTEGKVIVGVTTPAVARNDEPVDVNEGSESSRTVSAGERMLLDQRDVAPVVIEPSEVEVRLSWRGGNLVFRGEPLADALAEIERYTPVEFVIQDEDLKKIRIVGMFKVGDVEGLLKTLRQNFNIGHERVGDKEVLLKRGLSVEAENKP